MTSRHIAERLTKELDRNLALRVQRTESDDAWTVFGRGVLHLAVLIETMRREGYELQVGQPQVIVKEINGVKCEPVELLSINVPEEYSSKIIDMVTRRKRRNGYHDYPERPHTDGIQHSVARHHRSAHQCAYSIGRAKP